jgi:hypothetical protein
MPTIEIIPLKVAQLDRDSDSRLAKLGMRR